MCAGSIFELSAKLWALLSALVQNWRRFKDLQQNLEQMSSGELEEFGLQRYQMSVLAGYAAAANISLYAATDRFSEVAEGRSQAAKLLLPKTSAVSAPQLARAPHANPTERLMVGWFVPRRMAGRGLSAIGVAAVLGALSFAPAAHAASSLKICADTELSILVDIERHAHQGTLPAAALGSASLQLINARTLCYQGVHSGAMREYSRTECFLHAAKLDVVGDLINGRKPADDVIEAVSKAIFFQANRIDTDQDDFWAESRQREHFRSLGISALQAIKAFVAHPIEPRCD